MSVFSGFVTIWVKLPSSAPTLWFDVLSLVNWAAGLHCLLPSASDVLSEYLQSAWGSHFCRGLLFFGLNSFLTYSCAGELQLPGCTAKCFQCTVRVPSIFFGLNSFLTYSCAGELQSPGCTVCCQVLPMYCQSTFNPSGEVTSVFLFQ